MVKRKDITYCYKCKKYIGEVMNNSNNFPVCPKCNGYNIIRIQYEEDGSFYIEESDENCFGFRNFRQYKSILLKIINLVEKSRR
jgi:predicted RNA-binding Zn-ribbon protein involved in translation (DUF1610 family)